MCVDKEAEGSRLLMRDVRVDCCKNDDDDDDDDVRQDLTHRTQTDVHRLALLLVCLWY